MQINDGDKLVATKKLIGFFNEGDIIEVTSVSEDGLITFNYDYNNDDFVRTGVMDVTTCEKHFEKIPVPKINANTKVTYELVDKIMQESVFSIQTVFDKCTIVSCKLPNGFVIVESSACVSPENYSEEIGADICFDKIADKIFELEAYKLQEELYRENHTNHTTECSCEDCSDCDECPYIKEFADDDEENGEH